MIYPFHSLCQNGPILSVARPIPYEKAVLHLRTFGIKRYIYVLHLRTKYFCYAMPFFRLFRLNTTLFDKVCQLLTAGRWFSPGTLVSSTKKTNCHNITEILLKVTLNTISQIKPNRLFSGISVPPSVWASAPSLETMRTTNDPEAFRCHDNEKFYSTHLSIVIFVDVLLQNPTTTYIKCREIETPLMPLR